MITMGSLFLVIVILIGSINLVNLYQMNVKADNLLVLLADNNGKMPQNPKDGPREPKFEFEGKLSAETPFITRYFVVRLDEIDAITQIDTGHVAAISSAVAQEYAQKVLASKKLTGYRGDYKFLVAEQGDQKLLLFVDCHVQIQSAMSFLWISCVIALFSMLVVFILVWVLSKRAVRPVIEQLDRQKQFITDAGHEIKTPLAIISANSDVLELQHGSNEWVGSIKNQTKRLDSLVKGLLSLARLDEGKSALEFSEFSLSKVASDTASGFETLAVKGEKTFSLQVQSDLVISGNEGSIRQLISILVDNAVKYTPVGGNIAIVLARQGNTKKILFEVVNTYDTANGEIDMERLFDRFYRADSSRASGRETGGYGIGLSIAKEIAQLHKCRITANRQGGLICFRVLF